MGTKTRHFVRRGAACALFAAGLAAHPALAAGAATSARAVTLRPLSLLKIQDLEFGNAISTAAAGTIVINPDTSARTTTGGVLAAGGVVNAAQFYTYGGPAIVLITHGPLPVLNRSGGGATMAVTDLSFNGPQLRFLPAPAFIDLRVGGTLAVAANQLQGSYSGTFTITVTYF